MLSLRLQMIGKTSLAAPSATADTFSGILIFAHKVFGVDYRAIHCLQLFAKCDHSSASTHESGRATCSSDLHSAATPSFNATAAAAIINSAPSA